MSGVGPRPLLLLVDLQRDYLAAPGLQPAAFEVTTRARTLLEGFRALGAPVVHVVTTVSREHDNRMRHWKLEDRWICEEGTPGHEPPRGLEPREGEVVLHKTTHDPFADGRLETLVRRRRADPVVIAGVHLHACVREAALGSLDCTRGEVWVAEDATATDDPVHAAATRRWLSDRAVRFAPVAGVLSELGGAIPEIETEVDAVAGRCAAALPAWRASGVEERVRVLRNLADLVEPRAEELAQRMARELGKPVSFGSGEVGRTASMLRAVAGRCMVEGRRNGAEPVRHRPLGVVACITPWNNPAYIPLAKIGPALAYGNAVLWKPAPKATAISELLASLMAEAGLAPGVVELVRGGAHEARALMAHAAVHAVTITGSAAAGAAAQEACARRHLPLQAELGGNNAALVWEDADVGAAAREIAHGAFAMAGQRCTANRRVVVHERLRADLLERFARETAALPYGDPLDPRTVVGPLITEAARDRVAGLVGEAPAAIVSHDEGPSGGAFHPPTIVPCDDPGHELVQEETFGPVAVVQTAGGWEQAMDLVNGVRQGLAAAIFTASGETAGRFADEAEVGIVKINRSTADAGVDVPFGGWKASGIGPPEHGEFDRHFYTRPQTVYA